MFINKLLKAHRLQQQGKTTEHMSFKSYGYFEYIFHSFRHWAFFSFFECFKIPEITVKWMEHSEFNQYTLLKQYLSISDHPLWKKMQWAGWLKQDHERLTLVSHCKREYSICFMNSKNSQRHEKVWFMASLKWNIFILHAKIRSHTWQNMHFHLILNSLLMLGDVN